MTDYDEIKDRVDALLTDRFYEFHVYAAGQTKRDDWDCDSWRVVITGPEKRRLETPYYTGLAHRKWVGMRPTNMPRPGSLAREALDREHMKPVKPRAADVLHSLLLDGEAINQSFNDWCANFDADPDSMKQFKIYQACCETGEQLRKLFPHDLKDMLQELTQEL